jgi:two-component system OmpR family response regulator
MKLIKVLLVEDDRSIANTLIEALQSSYHIETTSTGRSALYRVDSSHYDIIVLDLALPDMDGLEICQVLRERGFREPILVLSAEASILTKIKLLDYGANDYLTKPFSLGELKARLRALTRVSHQVPRATSQLVVGDLVLNRLTCQVKYQDTIINLRPKELALLEYLMENAGSVVTRRALTRYAWPGAEELWTNTVDVHIKYLRDKIDKPFGTKLIRTIHGFGYKLDGPGLDPVIDQTSPSTVRTTA